MLLKTLKEDVLEYFKKRTVVFYTFLMIFMMILGARMAYMQVVGYENYKRLSENNRIRLMRIKADRGFIKDAKGRLVVKNTPSYELNVVKEDVDNIDALLERLNTIVPIDKKYALKQIKKSYLYEPAVIQRGLNFEQVAKVLENSADFLGVEIGLESVRSYMDSKAFSHVLGYLSEVNDRDIQRSSVYKSGDMIGKTGIEKIHENILRGEDGARQVEVDSYGRILEVLSEKQSVSGQNIALTLDYDLQTFTHKLMKNKMGAVVVMDIENFDLLTMYSAPSYDLTAFTPFASSKERLAIIKNEKKPLLNRSIEGSYPPGSVYKILMSVIAIMEGKITPETTYNCPGELQYGNFTYRCWKKGGHGKLDLVHAIEQSCDVYFYNVGLVTGIDPISKFSKLFSLGRKTEINLPNEKFGFFPSREWKKEARNEPWYPGETIITSIGQGYISTTPMQIAVMLSGLFNGGKVFAPNLIKYIEDAENGVKIMQESQLLRQVSLDPEAVKVALEGMREVVHGDRATGYRAKVEGITIGGKTGTAQVVSLKHTEELEDEEIPEDFRDHSWFGSVFPVSNPKYVAVALIEHGGAGSKGAAPIVGAVINKMADLGYVWRQPR
ncbi:MAG: penicillin-binding protein 2 [Denitrovibrio sp.]|nr:MAG: penicillin-binding protein 2 [Denitrovibrio sp.]